MLRSETFWQARSARIGDVEIGWEEHPTYELEGHNLPVDDSEWV
jgi:hypothetical protein